jgi:alkylation response protein AidB-like acyl-CoA dehydrogenase
MVVDAARQLALREILPTCAQGDREGVQFSDGRVQVPSCFHRAYRHFVEGDWIALAEDPAVGGQGLPQVVAQAAREYIVGANFSFAAFGILSHGTGKMIELFGTAAQKALFLDKLYTGQWSGSMLLTEPEAGSDVGALSTSAHRRPDGAFHLSGTKIFITCGDHDVTENIIHPVLARIEGAPAGIRGVSLFLVPKIWVNDDGRLGAPNDILCTGVEEKMGIHASPTCSMALGSRGACRGMLLGEENQGMQIMFHMMNEARLGVGQQGYLHGSAAYLYAAAYAKQRRQGRALVADRDGATSSVPIIQHPDVRRMLMRMKTLVEGMRSFTLYVAQLFDLARTAAEATDQTRCQGLIDYLTPVVKAYCSERGMEICDLAMNVFGGYGYTREYPIEQLMRDCKIATIYEGTNGIQAMDLLGRKLSLRKGEVFMHFLNAVRGTVRQAEVFPDLRSLCERLETALHRYGEVAIFLGKKAMGADAKLAFAHAHPFLEITGDIIMAWMLLWRALAAHGRAAANRETAFYDGQIKSAAYFITTAIPVTIGKINAILESDTATMLEIADAAFGG